MTKSKILLALLCSRAESVSFAQISELFNISLAEARELAEGLNNALLAEMPLYVKIADDRACISLRREYGEYLRRMKAVRSQPLSDAALEAFAVIVWKQPVTRSEIEEIRGVDCETVLGTLEAAKLIQRLGTASEQGAPTLYGITDDACMRFGFGSFAEMSEFVEEYVRSLGARV